MNQKKSRISINKRANKRLKELYLKEATIYCEARLPGCMINFGLSWHHRHKRLWYYDKPEDLLSDFNQTILVCANCHGKVERDKELNNKTFKRLRGDELPIVQKT